ncbi:MAG: adenylosuccinate lyase [Candidatus Verstraetearchaeota archaeon]|nr:adenylosuccinate lyase [Candidatus Verstraetearchaeota archaeon]
MPVCPIDTGRYGSKEMRTLFDEEGRLQRYLDVEAALALALSEIGEIPKKSAERIRRCCSVKIVTPEKVKEREARTRHDLMAMVEVLSEECGEEGKYVHWGATSYDIVDTSWALIMKQGTEILEDRLRRLRDLLCDLATRYKELVMVGRTHGQHATPITLGFKMAVYAAETARNLERLRDLKKRLLVGKMSGAVGTMASQGANAFEVERRVMERLGLRPAEISTQVVCRDRIAEFVCWSGIVASSMDRIATEVRNLQRTEILEVAEGFEASSQVGSSTMPHKQNPVDCEKVSGLAKVIRGLILPALENIPLWHERDLTDSSSERFIIPFAFILLDEILRTMERVLKDIRVFPENMRKNLELTRGAILSEAVMMALARKGMGRQTAHEILRRASARAFDERKGLKEVLEDTPQVTALLTQEELAELLKPENYTGKAKELVERAVKYAKGVDQKQPSDEWQAHSQNSRNL